MITIELGLDLFTCSEAFDEGEGTIETGVMAEVLKEVVVEGEYETVAVEEGFGGTSRSIDSSIEEVEALNDGDSNSEGVFVSGSRIGSSVLTSVSWLWDGVLLGITSAIIKKSDSPGGTAGDSLALGMLCSDASGPGSAVTSISVCVDDSFGFPWVSFLDEDGLVPNSAIEEYLAVSGCLD